MRTNHVQNAAVTSTASHLRRYCGNLIANVPDILYDDLLFFTTKVMMNDSIAHFLFFDVADVNAK